MPRYNVEISPGNSVQVEANTPEEARAKVEQDIKQVNAFNAARIAAVPYLDNILFDYERGVQDSKLRRQLARAETPKERFIVAENNLGRGGFTVNSKGQIAATAQGLQRLGMEPEYIETGDGSLIAKNVIVDENSPFTTGDLADFAGITGPLLGAIAALTPQTRALSAIKKATSFFNGGPRLNRIIASGLGTAAGKGAEEAVDAVQGFQKQSASELGELLTDEFILGAVGQGIGEGFGSFYNLMLGKQAPFDNIRLYRQAVQGIDLDDVLKFDAKLGREATDKEIKKAIKDGLIKKYSEKGLPSQGAFNRSLPGRAQALTEQVLGNTRSEETKKYLFRMMTSLFGKLNKEKIQAGNIQDLIKQYRGRTTITAEQKGALDRQVQDQINKLRSSEKESLIELQNLLDEMTENVTGMGIYGERIGKREIGNDIREAIIQARKGVAENLGTKYGIVDQYLTQLNDPRIMSKIHEVAGNRFDIALKKVKELERGNKAAKFKLGDTEGLSSNPINYFKNIINDFKNDINTGQFKLKDLRDTLSSLKEEARYITSDNQITKLIDDVIEDFSGIFDDLDTSVVGAKLMPLKELTKQDQAFVGKAIKELKQANKDAQEFLKPFDSQVMKKIRFETSKGAYDPDEIYRKVFYSGQTQDLKNVFQSLKNYDDYLVKIGKADEAVNQTALRNSVKQKLFTDAFQESLDVATDTIDFSKFATYLQKFERASPGKLRELFGDEAGLQFEQIINQLVKLKPNLKSGQVQKLLTAFSKPETGGIVKTQAGSKFLKQLETLAKESAETAKFEGNQIIGKLPEATTEEVVNKVFSPQGASNIRLIRETVSPEVFQEIQNNAMNKLLSRAIDFDGLTKKADIAKIFNPDAFNNMLRSYGDETLEAMFGREVAQGLRNYGRSLEIMTAKEVGRGGAAGTLVAAGIAINAYNPALWGTVIGLSVLRSVFQNPQFLKLMARTDKSAVVQLMEVFERLFRLSGVRAVGDSIAEGYEMAEGVIGDVLESTDLDEQVLEQAGQAIQQAEETARDVNIPRPTVQIEMPEIQPLDMPQLDVGLSPERIEFAERIAGRPVV